MHINLLILLFFLLVLDIIILPLVCYLTSLNMPSLALLSLQNCRILNNCKIFHYRSYDFFLPFHYALASLVLFYNALFLAYLTMFHWVFFLYFGLIISKFCTIICLYSFWFISIIFYTSFYKIYCICWCYLFIPP